MLKSNIFFINKKPNYSVNETLTKVNIVVKDIDYIIDKQDIINLLKLKLDNEKMERNLIIIKKVSTTAKKYPRKPGMPAKQPL